jgi:large subunit ribosomal protein L22
MSKKAHERSLDENEAQAVARMLRISPQKLNPGRGPDPRQEGRDRARRPRVFAQANRQDVRKCLQSAIANAENNHELDIDDLIVAEAHVGKGAR